MHVIAGKAVALQEATQPSFREYSERVVASARALGERLVERGLRLVSGGTDNHLLLVDVGSIGLTGADAEEALGRARLTVNKNMIPFDTQPPMKASGIRLGTPALCSRGFGPDELTVVGDAIADVLAAPGDEEVLARVRGRVDELVSAHPLLQEA
jgi:glycine hydroxymethyltransferase